MVSKLPKSLGLKLLLRSKEQFHIEAKWSPDCKYAVTQLSEITESSLKLPIVKSKNKSLLKIFFLLVLNKNIYKFD